MAIYNFDAVPVYVPIKRSPWGATLGVLDSEAPTDPTAGPKDATKYKDSGIPIPKVVLNAVQGYQMVHDLMYAMGVKDPVADWVAAQASFESTGFTSNVGKKDNNWSGIKWLNKPYQKNASKGIKSPDGGYYAKFDTWQDWARDLYRILHLGGAAAPVNAATLEDYVHRLKNNGYFGASEASYLKGVKRYLKVQQEGVKLEMTENPVTHWWENLDWKYKVGGGIFAGLLVLAAVRRR